MTTLMLVVGAVAWIEAADEPAPLGTVDVGFLQDMLDHHDQALPIANAYLENNPDGGAATYAREVLWFQQREIESTEAWLTDEGLGRGYPGRTAMPWMGMGTPVARMPGMQDPSRIAELQRATGRDADRLFFEILSAHHLGGAHMAEYAAAHADRDEVREFAEKMNYNQRIEVVEYEQAVARLGL